MKLAKTLGTLPLTFVLVTGCTQKDKPKEVQTGTVHIIVDDLKNNKKDDEIVPFEKNDTLMEVMKDNFKVQTAYDGKFIRGINGTIAEENGDYAWLYTINGKEATVGPNDYFVKKDDKIEFEFKKWK